MNEREEFLKKILATFRIEAEEAIKSMGSHLIGLEKNPSEPEKSRLLEAIYRFAHSLKGAARTVNMKEIEQICQSLEGVFSAMKSKKIELKSSDFDVLHNAVNLLNKILFSPDEKISGDTQDKVLEISTQLTQIESGDYAKTTSKKSKEKAVPEPKPEPETTAVPLPKEKTILAPKRKNSVDEIKKPSSDTVRISIEKLDKLLFQIEELLAVKLTTIQLTGDIQSILKKLTIWNKESSDTYPSISNTKQTLERKKQGIRLSGEEIDITKIIRFYEWTNSHIKTLEEELIGLRKFSTRETYSTGAKIESLLDDVKYLMTVPFSSLLEVFPKAVRDLSYDMSKQTELIIEGGDIEIDRRILEEIYNPLLHIIRNCVDYGIEKPDARELKGKVNKGNITIKIEQLDNNKVEILVSDDGSGINFEKLKKLYAKEESIPEEDIDKITEKELLEYIFRSGVSTSDIVTDISGRGLGLAIVQEKIEQLGGTVTIETEKDIGTKFRMQLPLSIITFRGVLIRVSNERFIIPTTKINRVLRINKSEIKTVENKTTMMLDGKVIPFVRLCDILEIPAKEDDSEYLQVLVFGSGKMQVGFCIDEILSEQEILVKKFNKHLSRIRNISGATILGSGQVVPILNVSDLIKSALKEGIIAASRVVKEKKKEEKKLSVLVVEDSITSRMLLKNILETAGYQVTTAIDGVDGFTKLKKGDFNAVVSDIDMPRMDGFDFTSKIRADKNLAEKPVVLVTSLSKPEDRERGIEVGANAYIFKSSFDQSNLLEILERLI